MENINIKQSSVSTIHKIAGLLSSKKRTEESIKSASSRIKFLEESVLKLVDSLPEEERAQLSAALPGYDLTFLSEESNEL